MGRIELMPGEVTFPLGEMVIDFPASLGGNMGILTPENDQ